MSLVQPDYSASVLADSVPSDAELVERARTMGVALVRRQAETEERTCYSEETHRAFQEAGFYRMLVPRRFGGYEVSLRTYFRVIREISRNCPSTGWMISQSTHHALTVASYFSEKAQTELFAGGQFIAPLTNKVEGVAERAQDGGWRITGTFHYASGAPYSTHMISHATPTQPQPDGSAAKPILFIAPRSEYTILNDWGDVLGLKGSGSNSVRLEGGYVPAHYILPGTFMSFDLRATGRELHDNSMYAGSGFSFYLLTGASVAVGTAMGAVDEYERLLREKLIPMAPFGPRAEDADYQRWLGTALGQVATAEAALDSYALQWMEISERDAWKREEDLRLAGICREAVNNLSWNAVQTVVRTAGSSAIKAGQRMERVLRDFSQLYSHGWAFLHDIAARELTRERIASAATREEGS